MTQGHIGCSLASHFVEHDTPEAMIEQISGTAESTDENITLRNSYLFLQHAPCGAVVRVERTNARPRVEYAGPLSQPTITALREVQC
jgi:hypothetical protein